MSSTQHQKLGLKKPKEDNISKDDWGTPLALFNWAAKFFNFTLDAAAAKDTALCEKYYTKKDNALKKNWVKGSKGGDIWLNHPYSQNEKWIMHCWKESQRGGTICNFGPADTSCKYWELYYKYCTTIYLISGRVKHRGANHMATFAQGIYVFGKDKLAATYNQQLHRVCLLKLPPKIRGGVR